MEYTVFAVRDVLNGFGVPMCDLNEASAIRTFKMALSNPDFPCPADYDLFAIGTYNMAEGLVKSFDYPKLVFRGASVRPVQNVDDEVNSDDCT